MGLGKAAGDGDDDEHILISSKADDDLVIDNTMLKVEKPKRQRKAAEPKPKKERLGRIDVQKSILEDIKLTNPDLYGDDDVIWNNTDQNQNPFGFTEHNDDYNMEIDTNQKLDYNVDEQPNAGPKKDLNSFLNKMKKPESSKHDMKDQLQQLGFIKDVNVNELAAKGV